MTTLGKKISRVSRTSLDAMFGPDRGRRLVCAFIPGNGNDVEDLLELRPERTRRAELVALVDVYRWAIRCRVNRQIMERLREKKAKKQVQRERQAIARADKRISKPV